MSNTAAQTGNVHERDELLDAFWEKGLVLLGDRVREEYGLATPVFIDLRHKLYDDLVLLRKLGERLHAKLEAIVGIEAGAAGKPRRHYRHQQPRHRRRAIAEGRAGRSPRV
jgi:hypothetical protein